MQLPELRDLLSLFKISLELWGRDQAKTVEDLLAEISLGECYLKVDSEGLWRVTERVQISISSSRRANHCLIESMQILPDGRSRPRWKLPSGKLRRGETPLAAMQREVAEELNLFSLPMTFMGKELKDWQSKAYPGLKGLCTIHTFKAVLEDSPLLLKETFEFVQEDGTRQTFTWGNLS